MSMDVTFDVPSGLTGPITLNSDLITVTPSSSFAAELKLEVDGRVHRRRHVDCMVRSQHHHGGPRHFHVSFRVKGENVAAQLLTPGTTATIATVKMSVRPASP